MEDGTEKLEPQKQPVKKKKKEEKQDKEFVKNTVEINPDLPESFMSFKSFIKEMYK